jgi:hypothetical protein
MTFDGVRALAIGDYVTVDGKLGPWADVVSAIGIDPRGTPMKLFFVTYGAAWLAVTTSYLRGRRYAKTGMAVAAAGACPSTSVWYLAFGTISSVGQLIVLAAGSRRRR